MKKAQEADWRLVKRMAESESTVTFFHSHFTNILSSYFLFPTSSSSSLSSSWCHICKTNGMEFFLSFLPGQTLLALMASLAQQVGRQGLAMLPFAVRKRGWMKNPFPGQAGGSDCAASSMHQRHIDWTLHAWQQTNNPVNFVNVKPACKSGAKGDPDQVTVERWAFDEKSCRVNNNSPAWQTDLLARLLFSCSHLNMYLSFRVPCRPTHPHDSCHISAFKTMMMMNSMKGRIGEQSMNSW